MRAASSLVVALAVALAACGGKPARSADDATRPSTIVRGEAGVRTTLPVPEAGNALDGEPEDGPLVELVGTTVKVDGRAVDDVSPILASKRLMRLDRLWETLKNARVQWKEAHAGAPFPGHVNFAFAPDANALVVKSVFQTSAFAGYPNARFLVRTPRGPGWLDVDAQVPRPPGEGGVNGRLPPETIQAIVRKHFGVFRACYEDGLRRDPNLTGRVAVKFVIERDGRVRPPAEDAGSTIPDPKVVACILHAYETLVFPPPDGGIVTVVYPIDFKPGD